jgi:ABC-type iron transport system FetAB ATPase subunit
MCVRVLVNAVIRNFVMSDKQAKVWFTHNVEEVRNFQFFLPNLYAEHHGR